MEDMISLAASWIAQWPTWKMIRALGFTAYQFLFIGMATGILQSMFRFQGKAAGLLFYTHTFSLRAGLLLILGHCLLLVVDTYQPFSWHELFIPFVSISKPLANGLGILAFYLVLFLALNSEVIPWLGKKRWHWLHLLAYPTFLLAMIHGISAGTDSNQRWAIVFYSVTGGIILFLTALRALIYYMGGHTNAHSSGRGRPQTGKAHPLQTGKSSS